jgi:hypothetical protein
LIAHYFILYKRIAGLFNKFLPVIFSV